MDLSEESTVLSSWKDIARYMGKGVRTVQRWERHLGLPVRRPNGASRKSAVLLDRGDLEAWMATRFSARTASMSLAATKPRPSGLARTSLREGIRTARELRDTNHRLTRQIADSIRLLAERCDLLGNQTLEARSGLAALAGPEPLASAEDAESQQIA
jgi:hypothetical protein